jgi:WD40 repeat protein
MLLVCLTIIFHFSHSVFTAPQPIQTWYTDGSVRSLRYSPDGHILASVETTTPDFDHERYVVQLRQIPTGQIIHTLGGQAEKIYALAFSHNGQLLATGDQAARVRVWRVRDGTLLTTMTGHTAPVQQVLFQPDDTTLLSVSDDYTIRVWDSADGSARTSIPWSMFYNCGIAQVGFVGTEARFAVREGTNIVIRTVRDQHLQQSIHGFEGSDCTDFEKLDLRLSANAQLLASVDAWHGRETTIRLWNLGTGDLIAELYGHTDSIASLAFSADNQLLASASGIPYYPLHTNGDLSVRIWRIAGGHALAVFDPAHTGVISGLAFSPDNRILASGGVDGTIRFWQVPS